MKEACQSMQCQPAVTSALGVYAWTDESMHNAAPVHMLYICVDFINTLCVFVFTFIFYLHRRTDQNTKNTQ